MQMQKNGDPVRAHRSHEEAVGTKKLVYQGVADYPPTNKSRVDAHIGIAVFVVECYGVQSLALKLRRSVFGLCVYACGSLPWRCGAHLRLHRLRFLQGLCRRISSEPIRGPAAAGPARRPPFVVVDGAQITKWSASMHVVCGRSLSRQRCQHRCAIVAVGLYRVRTARARFEHNLVAYAVLEHPKDPPEIGSLSVCKYVANGNAGRGALN